MKKRNIILTVALLAAIALTACGKEALPVPEYPLTEEKIAEAMKECGFPENLRIEESDDSPYPGMKSAGYTLRFDNKEIFAGHCLGILSRKKDDIRGVGVTVSNLDEKEEFSEEECKQAIIFATRLFGGFSDETEVYDEFAKEFDIAEALLWRTEIEGIDCQISYNPSASQTKLQIVFATDWETFYPES